eukprot:3854127-Amphidinium_carterae.1
MGVPSDGKSHIDRKAPEAQTDNLSLIIRLTDATVRCKTTLINSDSKIDATRCDALGLDLAPAFP